MTMIKELPLLDRPIERLINNGVESLSNEELLSIILKTGTKEKSVKDLSLEILKKYNIHELVNVNMENITKIKGIGKVKASSILACIELGKRMNKKIDTLYDIKINNCEKVFMYYNDLLKDETQEYFYCLYLDNNNKVIKNKMLFKGTLNYSTVHPREIFKEAYLVGATSIICIHNHPTGNIEPSKNDIELTNKLVEVGNILGVKISDHLIIGKDKYFSFFENNLV